MATNEKMTKTLKIDVDSAAWKKFVDAIKSFDSEREKKEKERKKTLEETIKREIELEQVKFDLMKKRLEYERQANEKNRKELIDNFRKGFDFGNLVQNFKNNPFGFVGKGIESMQKGINLPLNKRFNINSQLQSDIAGRQKEISSRLSQLDKKRQKSQGFKKAGVLSKKDAAEEAALLEEQKNLSAKSSKLGKQNLKIAVAQAAINTFASALKTVLSPLNNLGKAVASAVKEMLDFRTGVATYNTSSSLITNASAREQQLRYGLSSSQNYAFSKAKDLLNIQSDEDLMYMNSEQRERMLSYMEKYSSWYEQMESSGVLNNIQEMQLEFNELKEELAMEFLSWVAENKDTIMTIARGIFEVIKTIANFIMSIVNFFTGNKASNYDLYDKARTSDSYSTNNNQSTIVNINANTTNNATGVLGSQEALNQWNQENWKDLAKQVVGAIGG